MIGKESEEGSIHGNGTDVGPDLVSGSSHQAPSSSLEIALENGGNTTTVVEGKQLQQLIHSLGPDDHFTVSFSADEDVGEEPAEGSGLSTGEGSTEIDALVTCASTRRRPVQRRGSDRRPPPKAPKRLRQGLSSSLSEWTMGQMPEREVERHTVRTAVKYDRLTFECRRQSLYRLRRDEEMESLNLQEEKESRTSSAGGKRGSKKGSELNKYERAALDDIAGPYDDVVLSFAAQLGFLVDPGTSRGKANVTAPGSTSSSWGRYTDLDADDFQICLKHKCSFFLLEYLFTELELIYAMEVLQRFRNTPLTVLYPTEESKSNGHTNEALVQKPKAKPKSLSSNRKRQRAENPDGSEAEEAQPVEVLPPCCSVCGGCESSKPDDDESSLGSLFTCQWCGEVVHECCSVAADPVVHCLHNRQDRRSFNRPGQCFRCDAADKILGSLEKKESETECVGKPEDSFEPTEAEGLPPDHFNALSDLEARLTEGTCPDPESTSNKLPPNQLEAFPLRSGVAASVVELKRRFRETVRCALCGYSRGWMIPSSNVGLPKLLDVRQRRIQMLLEKRGRSFDSGNGARHEAKNRPPATATVSPELPIMMHLACIFNQHSVRAKLSGQSARLTAGVPGSQECTICHLEVGEENPVEYQEALAEDPYLHGCPPYGICVPCRECRAPLHGACAARMGFVHRSQTDFALSFDVCCSLECFRRFCKAKGIALPARTLVQQRSEKQSVARAKALRTDQFDRFSDPKAPEITLETTDASAQKEVERGTEAAPIDVDETPKPSQEQAKKLAVAGNATNGWCPKLSVAQRDLIAKNAEIATVKHAKAVFNHAALTLQESTAVPALIDFWKQKRDANREKATKMCNLVNCVPPKVPLEGIHPFHDLTVVALDPSLAGDVDFLHHQMIAGRSATLQTMPLRPRNELSSTPDDSTIAFPQKKGWAVFQSSFYSLILAVQLRLTELIDGPRREGQWQSKPTSTLSTVEGCTVEEARKSVSMEL